MKNINDYKLAKYLETRIHKMGYEINNLRHLTRILEELYVNGHGVNLNKSDFSALIYTLVRISFALSKQMQKLQSKLGI